MPELDDHELLAEFARNGSEAAFAALVTRYVNLVYSTALRFAGNPHHAEEITQAVFIILARKAGKLSPRTVLSGWLYQTARLTASNFVKGEIRRHRREQEAYMQSTLTEPDVAAWQQLAPQLDEAMGRLGETDRNAIVLRFFENKTAQEVGAALKLTEAAAHKRVNRALEKLRKIFMKRGVDSTAATIAETISANSVQAAPVALAKAVTAVAVAKGATASISTLTLIKGALKIMAWAKAKTAVVAGACVLLAAGTTTLTIYDMGKPMRNIQSEWSAISGNDGQWSWSGGKIQAHTIDGDSIFASSKKYSDVTFSAMVSTPNREASLAFRMLDASNGYILNFTPVGSPGEPNGFVRIRKRVGYDETTAAVYQGPRLAAAGKSAKIKVVAKGSSIQVFLNGANVLRIHDTTFTNGFIGLRVYGWEDSPCDATFSSVNFY